MAKKKTPTRRTTTKRKPTPKRKSAAPRKTPKRRAAASAKKRAAAKRPAVKRAAKRPALKKRPAAPAPKKRAAAAAAAASAPAPSPALALRAQRKQALDAKTVAALKAMLHKNDQIVTGTKTELVDRVLDRVEHGNLPRCPQCGLGRLRVSNHGGFFCPGGYDDDEYKACEFIAAEGALERPPWEFETPGLV